MGLVDDLKISLTCYIIPDWKISYRYLFLAYYPEHGHGFLLVHPTDGRSVTLWMDRIRVS